jgi:hypothetical protein
MYVEGIKINSDSISAEYIPPKNKTVGQTKMLNVGVVSLIEQQLDDNVGNSFHQKVIYTTPRAIVFEVCSGQIFKHCFFWTVPDTINEFWNRSQTSNKISVHYNGITVKVPENDSNRRFTSDVSVLIDGKLKLNKTVRIAQENYHGTKVADSELDKRIEVIGLLQVPKIFSDTETPNEENIEYSQKWFEKNLLGYWELGLPPMPVLINDKHLQYAIKTKDISWFGAMYHSGKQDEAKAVVAVLFDRCYDRGFKQEELRAVAKHELQHAYQVKDIAKVGSDWRIVDKHFPTSADYSFFSEVDADSVVLNANTCWKFMKVDLLEHFTKHYHNKKEEEIDEKAAMSALKQYDAISDANVKKAVRNILQKVYMRIPYDEIKRKNYDFYVRPPK